ncbi:hypothetical protein TRFO_16999 [Tritrichomonas foetus]|uniref:Uncharacterized protein n=1 Tax=Tritrichomonas foetus TaxID=1144522 RepID=A0A1J4KNY9_9EUKA|nr:hypothetical protein TRFO_16999 [Tritrichomonas foetus]|eukprot:OHT12947.1 hypothetical protein TRFO_16999 [Tritrichomonas foetus]
MKFVAPSTTNLRFYRCEFVHHLCSGNNKLALIFAKIVNDQTHDIRSFFDKMLQMQPPPIHKITKLNKDASFYYYCLHRLASYFDPEIPKIDYTQFFLVTFRFLGKSWSDQLYPYLTSSLDIPEKHFRTILKSLQNFANYSPSLYLSLRPQVSSILARIGPQHYIPILEFNIFDVLLNIDPSIIIMFPPNMINNSNIDKFLQYPAVVSNIQFISLFQSLTAANDPFPLPSKLFRQSNLFTLLNTVVTKRKHFVDIIFSLAHNTLMSRDFGSVSKIIDVMPELKPWLLLADMNDLYPDQPFLMSVINLYDIPKCYKNILQRFKNDDLLVSLMNQFSHQKLSVFSFEKESLPNLIAELLFNDPFELNFLRKLSINEYFVISDNSRKIDFNFIFTYLAILTVLKVFHNNHSNKSHSNGSDVKKESLNPEKLEQILHCIENLNDDILIDIYSLLFLRDDEGQFLCDLHTAEIILSVLLLFAQEIKGKSTIINTGFSKIHQLIAMGNVNYEDIFVSSIESTMTALDKHDFDMAKLFAAGDEKLTNLIQISQTIFDFQQRKHLPDQINNQMNNQLFVELFFATHEKGEKTNEVKDFPEEVFKLLEERKFKERENLLTSVGSSSLLTNLLNEIEDKLLFNIKLDDTFDLPVTSKFLEYYSMISKVIHMENEENETIMNLIIQSDKIEDWNFLIKILGENAIEKLINNCDLHKASAKMINLISKESPIIGQLIQQIQKPTTSVKKLNFTELIKFIPNAKNKELIQILSQATNHVNEIYRGNNKMLNLLERLMKGFGESEKVENEESDKSLFIIVLFNLLKETVKITSDLMFVFMDIADDLFDLKISEKVLDFVENEIVSIKPFPIEFAIEFRLRDFEKFNSKISEFTKVLSLDELAELFPEKVTKEISFFIDLGVKQNDPQFIIKELIQLNHISYASKYSNDFSLSSFFTQELISFICLKIDKNEDLSPIFINNSNITPDSIYSKLPSSYHTSRIQHIFNEINLKLTNLENIEDNHNANESNLLYNQQESEDKIIESISKQTSIVSISEIIKKTLNSLNITNKLTLSVKSTLKNILDQISVDSIESERKAIRSLITASQILKNLYDFCHNSNSNLIVHQDSNSFSYSNAKTNSTQSSEEFCSEISFLLNFCKQEFHLRFNVSYELKNINSLILVCAKYDEFELIEEAKNAFPSLNLTSSLLFMANNAAFLNQPDEFVRILNLQEKKGPNVPYGLNDVSELIRIISHPNVFEFNFNKAIKHVELSPMYYRIKIIIQGNSATINKDLFKLTDKAIQTFAGENELLKFHNSYGHFRLNNDSIESVESMIEMLICPSLTSNHWNGLWRFLLGNKDFCNNHCINILIDFLKQHSMHLTLFDLENRLQHKEDAIIAGSEVLQDLCSWKERLKYSSQLQFLAESEISEKKSGKRAQKISDRALFDILEKATITSEFCQLCIKGNVNFDQSLDVFKSDKSIESMALLAFIQKDFVLGLKLAKMKPERTENIISNSVDSTFCAGKSELEKYMTELRKQLNGPDYETCALIAVECIEKKLPRKAAIVPFVKNHIEGNGLQVSLLVQYGYSRDALKICNTKQNVMIVLEAATRTNDQRLIKDCKKMLS